MLIHLALASDKEVWDIACDELDELELDPNDPDYESEEEVLLFWK